jgi:hypothetical protein
MIRIRIRIPIADPDQADYNECRSGSATLPKVNEIGSRVTYIYFNQICQTMGTYLKVMNLKGENLGTVYILVHCPA